MKRAAHAEAPGIRHTWPHLLITAVLLVTFLITLQASLNLGFGSLSQAGPGLWPGIASGAGAILSIGLGIGTLLGINLVIPAGELFQNVSLFRLGVFIGGAILFLVLYPLLGFLAAAIPMMVLLLRYASGVKWVATVTTAIVAPLVLYVVFSEFLNVRI